MGIHKFSAVDCVCLVDADDDDAILCCILLCDGANASMALLDRHAKAAHIAGIDPLIIALR